MTAFSAFSFAATGEPTSRTLANRLSDIKNVKDFGAKGDGVTDDWAAITAAYNWTSSDIRGTIFFPPGNYLVSQPIIINGANFIITGCIGASIVTGNFGDYIFKRADPLVTVGNGSVIENLTVINSHATGGGIRMGNCVVGAIRNCNVTANQGISNAIDDTFSPLSSLDFSIENCNVSPGANVAGSNGIMSICDGPISNCRMVGFETGMRLWGVEGYFYIAGCYFEQNIIGIAWGSTPSNSVGSAGAVTVAGCWFKNNGIAIDFSLGGGGGRVTGVRIEASEAVTIGGARPQYGIRILESKTVYSLFSGIVVTGQYDHYGIYIEGVGEGGGMKGNSYNSFIGVQSFNTSTHGGLPWRIPPIAGTSQFIECNIPAIFTMANLPAFPAVITSISWSSAGGGTATATVADNWSSLTGEPQPISVLGVTPSGYNGAFSATITGNNIVSYTVANPGSSGTGGTMFVNPTNGGVSAALEGDRYNVNDASTATWGTTPVGSGSNHDNVRWNGSNWTVVGK